MRARIAVIASTIVLLTSSPASGQCAWVLWSGLDTPTPDTGFNTKIECEAEQERRLSDSEKMKGAQRYGRLVVTPEVKSGEYTFAPRMAYYTCLPDTIDPRGPKGGGTR